MGKGADRQGLTRGSHPGSIIWIVPPPDYPSRSSFVLAEG